ncbi:hypothetical protein K431DRAFT_313194 [Polychaeton citri CBS 116435]|uniref:Uncharacterized protein n=1 Tax=Polychaeton citri CBS 116435 TaxID=1314669 RepID=A0A9P4UPF9_9PEZI|nr:hypothetical protein K431DRAFT_313194 [Polychaeton citri CBS 116435]
MPRILSILGALGAITGALAQVEIDARFYNEEGCDNFATGCTDLAENSCCGVSQGGTVLYDSGDFYNTASGMGVTIKGTFFSRQESQPNNDCAIVVCGNIDAGECCNADITLSGASYNRPTSKRGNPVSRRAATRVAPDSYMWVEKEQSYYISMGNETKSAAIEAMRQLRDFTNMASFMKTHADVVKSELINIGASEGRARRL